MKRVHLLRRCERQRVTGVLRGGGRYFAFVEGVAAAVTDGERRTDDPETIFAQLVDVMLRTGVEPIMDQPLPSWFPRSSAPSMASADAVVAEMGRRWPSAAAQAFAVDHLDRPATLSGDAAAIATRCELVDATERALVQALAQGRTLGHALRSIDSSPQAMGGIVLALAALGRLRWASGAPIVASSGVPVARRSSQSTMEAVPASRPSGPDIPAARGSRPSSPGRISSPGVGSDPGPPASGPMPRPSQPGMRPEVKRTRKKIKRSSLSNLKSLTPRESSHPPNVPDVGARESSIPARSSSHPVRRSRPLAAPRQPPPINPMAPSTPFVDERDTEAVSPAEALLDRAREQLADNEPRAAIKTIAEATALDESHPQLPLYRAFAVGLGEHGSTKATVTAEAEKLETIAREILARDHNAFFAHFVRACVAMAEGRADDARRGFTLVGRLRPGDRWAQRILRALDRAKKRR